MTAVRQLVIHVRTNRLAHDNLDALDLTHP